MSTASKSLLDIPFLTVPVQQSEGWMRSAIRSSTSPFRCATERYEEWKRDHRSRLIKSLVDMI